MASQDAHVSPAIMRPASSLAAEVDDDSMDLAAEIDDPMSLPDHTDDGDNITFPPLSGEPDSGFPLDGEQALDLGSDNKENDNSSVHPGINIPPRIAARFYRSSSAQIHRKGSAASSRRNSISSTHSRSSSHSYGLSPALGTPQSKHVAQHIRRASILADRKARLADRAAHAEQVRLRAALAKAAVRDTSVSEERALAAAQAREKNLAEIAATCAEEVKRAKAIAETIKEKREQELLRLRQQIQLRLDDAERRREELRRNNAGRTRHRSQSGTATKKQVEVMPLVAEVKESAVHDTLQDASPEQSESEDSEGPALTKEEAAFKILHWWRTNHRRAAIDAFQELGLAVDMVHDTPLETVLELLARQDVLVTTGKVLRICGIQEGHASSVNEFVTVRTFLSAFVILGHPTQVLGNDKDKAKSTTASGYYAPGTGSSENGESDSSSAAKGRQEQELVGKAGDLLACFEKILQGLSPLNNYTPPSMLTTELAKSYEVFHDAFLNWKARDATALVDVMIKQFVELDGIWQSIKGSTAPHVTDTYRNSIQQNQLQLMVRIKKLAGPAKGKQMVFDAVGQARKAKAEARKKAAAERGKMRPRQANDTTIETAMGDLTGDAASLDKSKDAPSAPSTTQTPAAANMESATPSDVTGQTHRTASSKSGPATGTAPHVAKAAAEMLDNMLKPTGEQYKSSPLPENRVVVHELAMNREYRISSSRFQHEQGAWMGPVFHQMRKTMESDDPVGRQEHFFYLSVIASSIRSKLLRLTAHGKTISQFIRELFDMEAAKQQYLLGTFSYERFFQSVGQLLPKLCAPIRDEEVTGLVKTKFHEGDYVDRLQALEAFVDVMVTDHVNYMISIAAPNLLLSSTKYESDQFAKLVETGGLQLTAAEAAWSTARSKVLSETAKRDPEGINNPKSQPTPNNFYSQMLVDVFTQFSAIPRQEMPEMLLLDHERAQKCGALTRRIVTTAAVLLQSKNLLKRDVRVPWKTEANRIMMVLEKAEEEAANKSSPPEEAPNPDLQAALSSSKVVNGILAAVESGRSMPPATKTQLRTFVQRTISAVSEAAVSRNSGDGSGGDAVPQEPVVRLLLHRLRGYLIARLTAASSAEKTRQTNTVAERLTSLGLAEFVDRVREMLDEMSRVSVIDRETHGPFWDTVEATVSGRGQPTAVADGDTSSSS